MKRFFCSAMVGLSSYAMAQPTAPMPVPGTPPSSAHAGVKIGASGNAYLGVMVQEVDSERAKALKLPEEAGVEITHVTQDSPADKAGMKTGDVILRYNGERLMGMAQFSRLISETPVSSEVKLDIYRNGAPQTVAVKAGIRREPNAFAFTPPAAPPMTHAYEFMMPDMPRS